MLAGVPAEQHGWMIETMVAHEIGHCWRYVQGAWHSLPAGFEQAASAPELALQETRREEGYADLVALAWTAQRQPQRYGRAGLDAAGASARRCRARQPQHGSMVAAGALGQRIRRCRAMAAARRPTMVARLAARSVSWRPLAILQLRTFPHRCSARNGV
jgi:hypothetical protein